MSCSPKIWAEAMPGVRRNAAMAAEASHPRAEDAPGAQSKGNMIGLANVEAGIAPRVA